MENNTSIDNALVNAMSDVIANIVKLSSDEKVSDAELGKRIREALNHAGK